MFAGLFQLARALNTMVYYGLSYNTPNLDGDMYVNFFIGQMVEIPSVAVTMWLIYKYVQHAVTVVYPRSS